MKRLDAQKVCGTMPDRFERRVRQTLDSLGKEPKMKKISYRTCILAAALVVLLTATALAAIHWETLEKLMGQKAPSADEVMQGNIHQETVNGVEIAVQEMGYDGRTLWLAIAYHLPEAEGQGEPEEQLSAHGLGWWLDALWLNGRQVKIPSGSFIQTEETDTPGLLMQYACFRLDNEKVFLNGKTEIALPVGDNQPVSDYYPAEEHPERFDADGGLMKPEKGLVTFSFTPNVIDVTTEHPRVPTVLPMATAQTEEAVFSPVLTYISLSVEAADGSDEDVLDWLWSLHLVDQNGSPLFPDMEKEYAGFQYGLSDYADAIASYLFPCRDSWPGELYMAPVVNGNADMTQAIKVK